jgi:hypothetical protein
MKQYPSIIGSSKAPRKPCYAFYKYDGSNMRFEWTKKNGWWKFGCRTHLIGEYDLQFPNVKPLFLNLHAKWIEESMFHHYGKKLQKVTVFMEYVGQNSFAGLHDPKDEMNLMLIDVNIHKKGIMGPKEFYDNFGELPFAAHLVYKGNLNKQFIRDVREGNYPVNEGVVCKGGKGHKLWMCKIKTWEYLEKLKVMYNNDWQQYWE